MQVEWEDAWIETEDHLIDQAKKLIPKIKTKEKERLAKLRGGTK